MRFILVGDKNSFPEYVGTHLTASRWSVASHAAPADSSRVTPAKWISTLGHRAQGSDYVLKDCSFFFFLIYYLNLSFIIKVFDIVSYVPIFIGFGVLYC